VTVTSLPNPASMIEDLMIEQRFDVLFTPDRSIWIKASKT
jgi:hypothetical protein